MNVAASAEDRAFTYVPAQSDWRLTERAAYVHYTANETINGVEFGWVPDIDDVPLVSDMSSNLLSRPLDVGRFGLIYAGAQKNIGPAGLALVIVREDLIGLGEPATGHARLRNPPKRGRCTTRRPRARSMLRVWCSMVTGDWRAGRRRATQYCQGDFVRLHRWLEFYVNPVEKADRSRMNVPFRLSNPDLEADFLAGGRNELVELKGHRSVGGVRASLYNAMPIEGVQALVNYMAEFAATKG